MKKVISQLIYVQIDRIDGENAGYLINKIYESGARNVQLIPSLTKKGRPGYLLFIDIPENHKMEVERILIEEFLITGWYIFSPLHVFPKALNKKNEISISGKFGKIATIVPYKFIEESNAVILEHDYCIELQQEIYQKLKEKIALIQLKEKLRNVLSLDENTIYLNGRKKYVKRN